MRMALVLALLAAAMPAGAVPVSEGVLYDTREVRGAFLSRGAGARAAGMGEAFVAVADDCTAGSWNPGGLGQLSGLQTTVMYDMVGAGVWGSYMAGALPIGPTALGLGITLLNYGEYDGRDAQGNEIAEESLLDVGGVVSFAIRNPLWLGGRGSTGISLEVVKEAVGGVMFATNLGTVVPLSSQVKAGLAVRHLGSPKDEFSLPSVVHGGIACTPLPAVVLTADLSYGLVDGLTGAAAGTEVKPNRFFAVRLGYKFYSEDQDLGGIGGVATGFGVRIAGFGLDYAYQPFGELAQSHRVAFVYGREPAAPRGKPSPEPAARPEPAPSPAPVVKAEARRADCAVGRFVPKNVSPEEAEELAEALRGELEKTGEFVVLAAPEMHAVLEKQKLHQTRCGTAKCAQKLGKALGVRYVAIGSYAKGPNGYAAAISVIDVETANAIFAGNLKSKQKARVVRALATVAKRAAEKAKGKT